MQATSEPQPSALACGPRTTEPWVAETRGSGSHGWMPINLSGLDGHDGAFRINDGGPDQRLPSSTKMPF
jgi:hypothetical protein